MADNMSTYTPWQDSYSSSYGYDQNGNSIDSPQSYQMPSDSLFSQTYGQYNWQPMGSEAWNSLGGDQSSLASIYQQMGLNPTMTQAATNNDASLPAQYDFSGLPQLYIGGPGNGYTQLAAFNNQGQLQGKPFGWADDKGGWPGKVIQAGAMALIGSGIGAAIGGAAGGGSAGASDAAGSGGATGDAMGGSSGTLGAADSQAYYNSLANGGLDSSGAYAGGGQIPNTVNYGRNTYLTNTGTYTGDTFGGLESTNAGQALGRSGRTTALNSVSPGLGTAYNVGSNAYDNNGSGIMGSGLSGGDLVNGLGTLYGMYQNNKVHNAFVNNLSGMYGQDSPYAQALRQQLMRQDAAAGRRSQYGPREVELQARLADLMSRNAQPIYNAQMAQLGYGTRGLQQLMPLGAKFMNSNFMQNTAMPWMKQNIPGLAGLFGGGQSNEGGLNLGSFGDGMNYDGSTNPFSGMGSGDNGLNLGSFSYDPNSGYSGLGSIFGG
jgi:hypothetical protein